MCDTLFSRPPRVVIADDHALVRRGLKLMLEDERVAVVVGEAGSAAELVQLLAEVESDLLITDFSMPSERDDDGTALLRQLARRWPGLPVIVLTMARSVHLVRAMLLSGAKAVVGKTDGLVDLCNAIRAIESGRTYLGASVRELLNDAERRSSRTSGMPALSLRESEVLRLYASGLSVSAIAAKLKKSRKTVSSQKLSAMDKLSLASDLDLYEYARKHGLTSR